MFTSLLPKILPFILANYIATTMTIFGYASGNKVLMFFFAFLLMFGGRFLDVFAIRHIRNWIRENKDTCTLSALLQRLLPVFLVALSILAVVACINFTTALMLGVILLSPIFGLATTACFMLISGTTQSPEKTDQKSKQ